MGKVKIDTTKAKSAEAQKNENRPHHRTTLITTDKATYRKVGALKEGETLLVEFPNDIISSARGGASVVHHSIRRVSLLRRAINGGFRRVRVRAEQGREIPCVIDGAVIGKEDANVGRVKVQRTGFACVRA